MGATFICGAAREKMPKKQYSPEERQRMRARARGLLASTKRMYDAQASNSTLLATRVLLRNTVNEQKRLVDRELDVALGVDDDEAAARRETTINGRGIEALRIWSQKVEIDILRSAARIASTAGCVRLRPQHLYLALELNPRHRQIARYMKVPFMASAVREMQRYNHSPEGDGGNYDMFKDLRAAAAALGDK